MIAAALRNELRSLLTRAGVDNPDGDASLILEQVLGCSRAALIARAQEEVPPASADTAAAMARRRAAGEPIQYVLGTWAFMGRDYAVGEGVLIPRDDTEVVVRAALERIKDLPSPAAVDLCAGTGIIAITVKKELPQAAVSAVEKSPAAFTYLTENIRRHEAAVSALCADLCDCTGTFADSSLDLIISNPPYIRSDEIDTLQREIAYEPRMALDGGEDGCIFYEQIIRLWTLKLRPGGTIALELGEGQFDTVAALLQKAGCAEIRGYEDIQGILRAVTAVKIC